MNTDTQTVEVTKSDLRKFGFIMGGMIALMFGLIFPWIFDKTSENWPIWPFIVMAIFFVLAIAIPEILRPVNHYWLKIGNVLGFINSRIILGAMFYLMIFPIGMILKVLGKDSMHRKLEDNAKTYRIITKVREKDHLKKPF
ncbi:SxtJ family membrane protein [uncultured Cocleimonas sp.]|uniref:SxtJ family membrane protein n=1 Tax=uncultured Cocleimonas sp. TaxID=1051587 RepID=UPI00260745E2|nr:SxtJ family membrane protein [uncultured Cocleimonas sp.]